MNNVADNNAPHHAPTLALKAVYAVIHAGKLSFIPRKPVCNTVLFVIFESESQPLCPGMPIGITPTV